MLRKLLQWRVSASASVGLCAFIVMSVLVSSASPATARLLADGLVALLPAVTAAAKVSPLTPGNQSAYTSQSPNRILDTRLSAQTLGPNSSLNLTVAGGTTGVPASATDVILNVTVDNATASSFLTVWPAGQTRNAVSSLNFLPREIRPNLVSVPVGAAGQVSIYNGVGSVDVVVDEEGYFSAPVGTSTAGGYKSLPPARLLDTRLSAQTMNTGSVIDLQITGAGGVPATGVSAVVLNATATNTATQGYFTLYPSGTTRPLASNVNWAKGWTIPNRVIVKIGANGKVAIFNGQGSADAVIDVNGYFTDSTASGNLFTPVNPVRVLDTRVSGGTIGPNGTFNNFQVTGNNGVPAGATAAFLNTTVTNTTASSALTVYPNARPLASDLNWKAGQTIPNLTLTTLSSSGSSNYYNFVGSTDLVLDLSGYFGGAAAGVSVNANPSSIPADGATTSTVIATVTQANGSAAINDPVNFTTSGGASCGTFTAANPVLTNTNGNASVTYKASTTVGTCTIMATEANNGLTGTATIPTPGPVGTGQTYYVSPDGNDGDGLSWASAWKSLGTIQWSMVQPGDTLLLDGGSSGITYTSTLAVGKSGTALAPITIRVSSVAGHNGRVLIFGGRGTPLPYCGQTGYSYQTSGVRLHGITFNNASHVVIDGGKWDGLAVYGHDNDGVLFSGSESYDTLRNAEVYDNGTATVNSAGAWSTDAAGIRPLGSHLTFGQVDVHDNGQDAFQSGGPLNYITIHHSWLHFARQNPLYPAGTAFNAGTVTGPCQHQDGFQMYNGGIQSDYTIEDSVLGPGLMQGTMFGNVPYTYNGSPYPGATINNVTVRNTLVINSSSNGLMDAPQVSASNWRIDHVTVWEDMAAGPRSAIYLTGTSHVVTNSVFYGGNFTFPTGLAVSSGNCQWNTSGGSSEIKGLTANPLFLANVSGFGAVPSLTTQASADFGLQAITPCLGVGSSMTSVARLISTAA